MSPNQNFLSTEEIRGAIYQFIKWLDYYGEMSQDQYDFWAFPFGRRIKALYYRNKYLGWVFVTPIVALETFFPLARSMVMERQRFPIADAHYAMGFFTLADVEKDFKFVEMGKAFLETLIFERCDRFKHYCWGYPFDWETCFGTFKAGTPLITTVPYVYEAFEAGYEATGSPEYLRIMESVAAWAYEDLTETELKPGICACSYTPYDRRQVVNANAYRSFLLTAAGSRFGHKEWTSTAERNLAFVLKSQQNDGSWLYAMDGRDAFIDNFHTCFVLKNLFKVWLITRDHEIYSSIQRGYSFYKHHLLDDIRLPIPFARNQRISLTRRELYDFAEGMNLAFLLREIDNEANQILEELTKELLRVWVLPDGHFTTREQIVGRNMVPYHRWAQSQTFRILAILYQNIV